LDGLYKAQGSEGEQNSKQTETAVITTTIHEISSVSIVYRREMGPTLSLQQLENFWKDAVTAL